MPKCGGFFISHMSLLPYTKIPLSFEEQARLLLERGMEGDFDFIVNRLRSVNYYRLSASWVDRFQRTDTGERLDFFCPKTTFEDVWSCYAFDRRLRLYVTDALERIEIDFKTNFVNVLTIKTNDGLAHLNASNFPKFPISKHLPDGRVKNYDFSNTRKLFKKSADDSCEEFVRAHCKKYCGELPFWKVCEVVPFGLVSVLFGGADNYTKREVAGRYAMSAGVFETAIKHLCYVRNLCAHHSRLWNRTMAIRFSVPAEKNLPIFHSPQKISNQKIFGTLSLLRYFMEIIAPQSRWTENFEKLLSDFPTIPLSKMGFPENWKTFNLWKTKASSDV